MRLPRARAWRLAALALAAAGCAPKAAEGPRLVVLIVVDQLRSDYLDRFQDHYRGGFRWLLDHGAHFPDAAYRHASTVTAAGHATVSSGRHPSSHGIVGNSWREAGRGSVYCVEDDRYSAVGASGSGASPAALAVDTLGDRLKEGYPGSKVFAISTKDRSAVLLGGKRADGAFWFDRDCACLVSSTYYGPELPAWLEAVRAESPPSSYAGAEWTRLLDDEALYARLAREDRFPTEADGERTTFPHRVSAEDVGRALPATPFSDMVTLRAAEAALQSGELGADGEPDLLAIGLSATDSIGHRYGPFSQEAMDHHLRLDRALGAFLETVDEVVGLDRTVFALSADHGAVPLVEHLQAQGVDASRFDHEALWERAGEAVEACGAGPADRTVAQGSGTRMHWDEAALADLGIDRAGASACMADWLREQDGVEAVFTDEQLAGGGLEGLGALFANSRYPGRSAHVQVHLREGLYPGGPRGTGHGSAHAYDRRVPVLLAGQGIAPGRHPGPAGPEDIAPTLGAVLGLDMPTEPDTLVLDAALQPGP